jgi:response regulator RpfG family c-di-GMP phosphodiesterase
VKFDDVRLFLCDPRLQIRTSLRMALNDAGIRNKNIWEGNDFDAIEMAVADPNGPDIVICDVTENTDQACQIFNAIRHNELGTNPFICIIAVAWSPNHVLVSKVIDSGADLLVAAPISPALILDRIASLVHSRKPFVVTSDYVGPDRRTIQERESEIEKIEVPNSLRDKALGQFDPEKIRKEIEATRASINDQKIDRQALQLSFLADMVVQEVESGAKKMDRERLRNLVKVTNELKMRAFSAGAKELEEICVAVREVIQRMVKTEDGIRKKDVELLTQLSLAVRAAARPTSGSSEAAHDITRTVVGVQAAG